MTPFTRTRRATLVALVLVGLIAPNLAHASEYVRDGIRINLRSRPGTQYRIVRTLESGDRVKRISENTEWIEVRVETGERQVGWVPKGYLTKDVPPSLRLPRIEAALSKAQARVDELEGTLAEQSAAITELETLRADNATLSTDNMQLAGAQRWKSLGMGAFIALCGLVAGALWPRGGNRGTRRIKL